MTKTKPLRVTFESDEEAMCLALAMIGQGDRAILRSTNYTPSQVTYRLGKAKAVMRQEHGFRVMWRNGEGSVVARVKKDILGVLMADVQRRLPVQITKPTIKTVGAKR